MPTRELPDPMEERELVRHYTLSSCGLGSPPHYVYT